MVLIVEPGPTAYRMEGTVVALAFEPYPAIFGCACIAIVPAVLEPLKNIAVHVEDIYHDSYEGAPNDGSAWTGG